MTSDLNKTLTGLDKRRYRQAFNRAAAQYDNAAVLQREVGQRLLERFDYMRIAPEVILDAGSGTGFCSEKLLQRYKNAHVIQLDIAPAMLQYSKNKLGWWDKVFGKQSFLCADTDQLPLGSQSVDLIFSNLTLQWCDNLDNTFAEIQRVLKPEGLLMFSTLGPDTLKELRECWQIVDDRVHVHPFIDMHDVGDALLRNTFSDPVIDMEMITMTYQDARTLMRDLKAIGAHNASTAGSKGLTGKQHFKQMLDAYEIHRDKGVLPATYEVIYGQAWGTDLERNKNITANTVQVNIEPIAKPSK